jgi:cobalt-precorrin 5A hydrolase
VLALSRGGCALGRQLAEALSGDFFACQGRLAGTMARVWADYGEIVCIMAAGIVVRTVAPLLRDKYQDPAVVVCDELGRFAVSLLSGHLGGANDLARRVAELTGGQAVLTTASDVLGRTALDLWCRDLGLIPADKAALTRAMGLLVDRGGLTVWSRYPLPPLPADLHPAPVLAEADLMVDCRVGTGNRAALLLVRSLVVGIGCNRGTSTADIAHAVAGTLARHDLDGRAVAGLASIEVKRDEAGLLDFAARLGLPLVFFASDQLNQVEGVSISAAVLKATGAKGVAEPAALLAAGPGSLLVVAKEKWPDVTVAVAEKADPLAVAKGCQESATPPCDQPISLQVGQRRDKNL